MQRLFDFEVKPRCRCQLLYAQALGERTVEVHQGTCTYLMSVVAG